MNDALGAALASADDLISGRQVFRDDLERGVLDPAVGKAFLDRFQDICAHRRCASRGPGNAAHEKSDRERCRGHAPGAAGTERDRSSPRRARRARHHCGHKGSKAGAYRPLGTRANGTPSSARQMDGGLGICCVDNETVPPTKLCARGAAHSGTRGSTQIYITPDVLDAPRGPSRNVAFGQVKLPQVAPWASIPDLYDRIQ